MCYYQLKAVGTTPTFPIMLKASPVYADYLAGLAKNHTLPVAGIILGMVRRFLTITG